MVKAVEERSRSTPIPNVTAMAQARMPTATPSADIVEARAPPASALRTIRAVSGPGVAMIRADSATQASSLASSSTCLCLFGWFRSREEPDDLCVVLGRVDVVQAIG